MSCEAGIALGILCIRYYGILLMSGALAGGFLASREVRRRGYDPELVWDLLVYLIIGGVLGARLWHILTPPPSSIAQGFTTWYYLTHPLDALAIWKGGLGIPGTIIGGLIALYLYTRRNKTLGFLEWTDIAAPSLALGQAIGRWGNYFNQEIYGAPTNLPWKIFIDPAHRLAGFENQAYYHPLFAYEGILSLANMLLLIWITRRFASSLKHGDVFNVYLIFYPVARFGLDFLRLDASQVLSLNINQTVMAVVALLAAGLLGWRHRGRAAAVSAGATAPDLLVQVSPERPVRSAAAKRARPAAARSKPARKSSGRSSRRGPKRPRRT